jgi:hypothetical protein
MDFLHSLFDEQLEVQVDTTGNVVIGDAVFPPVVILRADRAAYDDEFSRWLSERWLPEQEDILEGILAVHANRKRFADLCAALHGDYLIPLVGSGMSTPSGLPAWSEFLRTIRQYSSMNEEDLEELLSRWDYEEAAEQLASSMPAKLFDERIEHDLRIDNPEEICGAVVLLPELFDKLVITTNLDDLLERMYDGRGRRFSHILCGRSIAGYRRVKASSERILLKLHGDCRTRDGRVLGKTEYEQAYVTGSPLREELTTIYRNQSLLCLGCSLNPDRTVELFAEVAAADSGIPRHYAFLQHPNDDDRLREREHFLTERDVFPIWYPGTHDESIQALLVGMMRHLGKL